MKEEFLHYLWKFKRLNTLGLTSTNNERIEILDFGLHNQNAGPDFLSGKVKIGDTIWAGNIEIHINSSDWNNHKHQYDETYNNVILHVVFNNDKDIKNQIGANIPTLEINSLINEDAYFAYLKFIESNQGIPCSDRLSEVNEFTFNSWLDRLAIERLERKSNYILDIFKEKNNNWEETFYAVLCRNFGFKVNADPYEILARILPLNIILKNQFNPFIVEALIFGQAGMLNGVEEEYPLHLQTEYQFQSRKYGLMSMDKNNWKFSKLRPNNFPTIRLAQLASLLSKVKNLVSKIIEAENLKSVNSIFENIETHPYWNTHYVFGKLTEEKVKTFGKSSVNGLVINTVIPFLFVYGKQTANQKLVSKSIKFLEEMNPEKNSILDLWKSLGVENKSALTSQALLELKNEYCSHKKCLFCAVGTSILKKYD